MTLQRSTTINVILMSFEACEEETVDQKQLNNTYQAPWGYACIPSVIDEIIVSETTESILRLLPYQHVLLGIACVANPPRQRRKQRMISSLKSTREEVARQRRGEGTIRHALENRAADARRKVLYIDKWKKRSSGQLQPWSSNCARFFNAPERRSWPNSVHCASLSTRSV
jgi:hypothetical protein